MKPRQHLPSHAARHVNWSRGLGATTLTLTLLVGCASHSPPRVDEMKVRQFAGQGYLSDDRYGIATTFHAWEVDGIRLDIALTMPSTAGAFPLVIYFPALGESRLAGDAWRTAWAQAGYAVVSCQLLSDDASVWSSERARTGDFTRLARERYAGQVVAERLAALRTLMHELSRLHGNGMAPFERLDFSRVAVAGYDIGAYTAMVLAGEQIRGPSVPGLPFAINAAIALSPHADFSGASFTERYSDIRVPVLSVTGDRDVDALGLVTSPSVRKAPFQHMPSGNKYLVVLSGVTHRTLAGGKHGAESAGVGTPGDPGLVAEPSHDGGRGGARRKGGGMNRPPVEANAGERQGSQVSDVQALPIVQAMRVAAIQGLTTAFLDAYVKSDPIAREWLARDAVRWIKDAGELHAK